MRKIEQEMLDALRERKTWSKSNTQVVQCTNDTTKANVYLFGNHIATVISLPALNVWEVQVNQNTIDSWPTRTTRSRLIALGVNAYISKGLLHVN